MGQMNNRNLLRQLLREAGTYFSISDRNNIVKMQLGGAAEKYQEEMRIKQFELAKLAVPADAKDIDILIEDLIQGTDGSRPMFSFAVEEKKDVESDETTSVDIPGFIWKTATKIGKNPDGKGESNVLYQSIVAGELFTAVGNWQSTADKGKAGEVAPMFNDKTNIFDVIFSDGAIAAAEDRAKWIPETPGNPLAPALTVFEMKDDYLCRNCQDVGLVQLFSAGIPSTELAQCVPYLDVRIIDTKDPAVIKTDGGKYRVGPPLNVSKFLKGFGEMTENEAHFAAAPTAELKAAAESDPDWANEDNEGEPGGVAFASAGMELFTMPQTFVGPHEKYIDLNPDGQRSPTGRPNSIRDPFQPLMTITGFDYSVESTNTVMSTLRGKLNIVLHDRTRLHEVAPLMRPDRTAGLEILVEWGWSHPGVKSKNFYGRLLNACRTKRKFIVASSGYQFNTDGSVNITLNMFAKGNRTLGLDLASNSSIGVREMSVLDKLAKTISKFVAEAQEENADVRTQSEAIFGNPAALGRFTSVDGMLSINAKELADLIKIVEGTGNARDRKRYGSTTRAETYKEIKTSIKAAVEAVGSYRTELDKAYAWQETLCNGELKDDFTIDPWREGWATIEETFYNTTGVGGKTPRQNHDGTKGVKKAQFNTNDYISLGRLFSIFVLPALQAKGAWEDIQLMFYPANEDSYGYSKFQSLASIPVRKEAFLKTFKTWRDTVPNPSLLMWITFTLDFVEKDYSGGGYGLGAAYESSWNENKGCYETKKAAEQVTKTSTNFGYGQRISEAAFHIYGGPRRFKKPALKLDVETIPVDKAENKSILRLHIVDASKDNYASYSEYLQAMASDAMGIITKRMDVAGTATKDAAAAGAPAGTGGSAHNSNQRELITQFDRLIQLGYLKKLEKAAVDPGTNVFQVKYLESTEWYAVSAGPGSIKYFLSQNLPTLKYGTEFSIMTTVGVSAQTDEQLAMIQLKRRIDGGGGGAGPDGGDGSFPMQLMPIQLTIETIGCPFFRHGQQFFFDFQTNTDIDNIYILTGIDHKVSPGKYSSSLRLVRVDKYGFFDSMESKLSKMHAVVSSAGEGEITSIQPKEASAAAAFADSNPAE